MSQQQQSELNAVEIGEVREAAFDPQVGESVLLEVNVITSNTRLAVSDAEVFFTSKPGPETVPVKTDGNGWARFAYQAQQPGDVEVIAALVSVDSKTASHTFRFKALEAAGVWGTARIQLNNDESITRWGESTLFPRTLVAHTINLTVDEGSHLLGRKIRLGLTGYSSLSELEITDVRPALGVDRTFTDAGLSWQFISTKGGAYELQLEASRILKLSPRNAISLGPVPPDEIADGN